MALRARISAAIFAALSDSLKAEYKLVDGSEDTYILDVTATDGYELQDISGLKSTLGKLKTQNKDLEVKLGAYKDGEDVIDPIEAVTLRRKFKEYGNLTPEELAKDKVKIALEQQQTQFTKLLGEKDTKIAESQKHLSKLLVDNASTAALAARKGNVKLLLPHVKTSLKLVEEKGEFKVQVVDADGNSRITVKNGQTIDMTVEDLVEEMSQSETYASAFEAQGKPGGGSVKPNGNGGNAPVRSVNANDAAAVGASLADIAAGRTTVNMN